jgi:hypothetical protein
MNIAIDSSEEGQSSISLWTDVSPFMLSIREMEERVDDVTIVLSWQSTVMKKENRRYRCGLTSILLLLCKWRNGMVNEWMIQGS